MQRIAPATTGFLQTRLIDRHEINQLALRVLAQRFYDEYRRVCAIASMISTLKHTGLPL